MSPEHEGPGSTGPGEPVGGVGEEAAKLFGALADWAKVHAPSVADLDLDAHLATGAPECTYCPICRTVHVIREAGPDVRAHLAVAAASLMQAAAGVLAAASADPARGRQEGVQKIHLDDDSADWPEED